MTQAHFSLFSGKLQDVFHFGKISKTVGNAFACSREEGWEETYVRSPSGLSNNRASVRYQHLVNREGWSDYLDCCYYHYYY